MSSPPRPNQRNPPFIQGPNQSSTHSPPRVPAQPPLFKVLELNDTITYHTAVSITETLQPGSWSLVTILRDNNSTPALSSSVPYFVRWPPSEPPQHATPASLLLPHEELFNRFYRYEQQPAQQAGLELVPGQIQPEQELPRFEHLRRVLLQQQQQSRPQAIKFRCLEPDKSTAWRTAEDIHKWCQPGFWAVSIGRGRIWFRL